MAAKRLLEKPPPSHSSSSDSDQDQQHNQNGVAPSHNPKPDSDSDSENSNPKHPISAFTIKPITDPKKKTQPPTRSSSDEDDPKESEKKKRKVSAIAEDPKSPAAINRVWSEDDEIAILKGMKEFKAEKGVDPNADMAGFHDFIRESLHVEASEAQLADKIEAEGGEYFWRKFPWLSESFRLVEGSLGKMMKWGLERSESSKVKELEEKWKELGIEEMELQIWRSQLALETQKIMLDLIKSSKL